MFGKTEFKYELLTSITITSVTHLRDLTTITVFIQQISYPDAKKVTPFEAKDQLHWSVPMI